MFLYRRSARSTTKLAAKAWEGVLVGFCPNSKGWYIYNLSTRRVRESLNIVFIEPVSRLVQPTVAGGDAASDFLVGTAGANTLSSRGVDISSDSTGDIYNGDSIYNGTYPDTIALRRDYDIYTPDLHSGRAALLDMFSTLVYGRSAAPVSVRGSSP